MNWITTPLEGNMLFTLLEKHDSLCTIDTPLPAYWSNNQWKNLRWPIDVFIRNNRIVIRISWSSVSLPPNNFPEYRLAYEAYEKGRCTADYADKVLARICDEIRDAYDLIEYSIPEPSTNEVWEKMRVIISNDTARYGMYYHCGTVLVTQKKQNRVLHPNPDDRLINTAFKRK